MASLFRRIFPSLVNDLDAKVERLRELTQDAELKIRQSEFRANMFRDQYKCTPRTDRRRLRRIARQIVREQRRADRLEQYAERFEDLTDQIETKRDAVVEMNERQDVTELMREVNSEFESYDAFALKAELDRADNYTETMLDSGPSEEREAEIDAVMTELDASALPGSGGEERSGHSVTELEQRVLGLHLPASQTPSG
jgi:hypothetical protein